MSAEAYLSRVDLRRPGVRLLNRGGRVNPDVLLVPAPVGGGAPCIVKDYGAAGGFLRRLLGRALARRELLHLERVMGLPGVPGWAERVGERALAMEFIEGRALTRREHYRSLPAVFFTALEGILEGALERGVVYLDLRSASNVLVTASGAPALVDFASATRFPMPSVLARWIYARALRKHRHRFERRPGEPIAPSVRRRPESEIDLGRVRFRLRDAGREDDARPLLLLHDVGLDHHVFGCWYPAMEELGRRAIGVDLPPFGGSRSARERARADDRARELLALLDALRLGSVDLVGHGFGALVALALASRVPERLGRGLLLGAPLGAIDAAFLARWNDAHRSPDSLRSRIRASIPLDLPSPDRVELERALEAAAARALAAPYRELSLTGIGARGYAIRDLPPLPADWSTAPETALVDLRAVKSWIEGR